MNFMDGQHQRLVKNQENGRIDKNAPEIEKYFIFRAMVNLNSLGGSNPK